MKCLLCGREMPLLNKYVFISKGGIDYRCASYIIPFENKNSSGRILCSTRKINFEFSIFNLLHKHVDDVIGGYSYYDLLNFLNTLNIFINIGFEM